jgi:hypothetical protein
VGWYVYTPTGQGKMADMTWKEFKEVIDKMLTDRGMPDDIEIWYIDIVFPKADSLAVSAPEMGLTITDSG